MAPVAAGYVPLIQSFLRRWRRPPPSIDETLWRSTCQACPWLHALDAGRQERLRGLAAHFLHRKAITPVAGLTLDDSQRLLLAALCCLPLLEFGEQGLQGWSELVVYPDAFRVRRNHVDAAGVLHEWDDELIGEAWDSGPLLLSWADVPMFGVGLVFSFISAWLCVRWLLRYISSHSFVPFAWYRLAFGALVLLTWWTGWVSWSE